MLPALAGTGVVDTVIGGRTTPCELLLGPEVGIGTDAAVGIGEASVALSRSFRILSLSRSRSFATESTKPATSVATACRSRLFPSVSARRLTAGVERDRLSAGGRGFVAGGVYAEKADAAGDVCLLIDGPVCP